MKPYVIRRNSGTGNWVMFWYSAWQKKYVIIGSAASMKWAINGIDT